MGLNHEQKWRSKILWHTPFKVKTINSRIYDQHMKLKEKLNLRDSIVHVLIGKKHQNVMLKKIFRNPVTFLTWRDEQKLITYSLRTHLLIYNMIWRPFNTHQYTNFTNCQKGNSLQRPFATVCNCDISPHLVTHSL